MKKISKFFRAFLAVVLVAAFSACNNELDEQTKDVGLGIKVFFPTKVVAGQPMTINGSGFSDVTEVVFPSNLKVTDFQIVSNDMIRVTAPAGIAAEGGKILVRTKDGEAESAESLTIGHTVISGYSFQEGVEVKGGEQFSIYGTDLEFISAVELLKDAENDGTPTGIRPLGEEKPSEPLLVKEAEFYRKGTNTIIVTVPKNVHEGTFAGKVHTYDGQVFTMPEVAYKPGSQGGHWETRKVYIWQNDGTVGAASWDGGSPYRFCVEGRETGEQIAAIPAEMWDKMKTGSFFITILPTADWFQLRVVDAWWSLTWGGGDQNDIKPGDERLIDNGDGTFSVEIAFGDDPIVGTIDEKHLLFAGDGYVLNNIYYEEQEWVGGEGGHWETRKTSIYKGNDDIVSWTSKYRFALDGHDGNNECCATFPEDVWEKIKTETFYVDVKQIDPPGDGPQVRLTNGWWDTQWFPEDIMPGNELLADNGDGSYTLTVNLDGTALVASIDEKHLLITGDRYMLSEIYFTEQVWVEGDYGSSKEVVIWENNNTVKDAANWDSKYRFALEGHDGLKEAVAEIPQEKWDKLKTGTFYLTVTPDGDWFQVRIVTGWWGSQWPAEDSGGAYDFNPNSPEWTDNGDGTFTLPINFEGHAIRDAIDEQHLLFTGSGFVVNKLHAL